MKSKIYSFIFFLLMGFSFVSSIGIVNITIGEITLTNVTLSGGGGGSSGGGITNLTQNCTEEWRCYEFPECINLQNSLANRDIYPGLAITINEKCISLGIPEEDCGYKPLACFDLNSCNIGASTPRPWVACNAKKDIAQDIQDTIDTVRDRTRSFAEDVCLLLGFSEENCISRILDLTTTPEQISYSCNQDPTEIQCLEIPYKTPKGLIYTYIFMIISLILLILVIILLIRLYILKKKLERVHRGHK